MATNKLTDTKVKSLLRVPGLHSDGNCLYLQVKHGGASWLIRFLSPTTRKQRDMGLGGYERVTLAQARRLRDNALTLVADGVDPIDQRKAERAAIEVKRAVVPTFNECWLEWQRAKLDPMSPRHVSVTSTAVERYVLPALGRKPVDQIDTPDIIAMLDPIWKSKQQTASRLRGVVQRVLDYAKVVKKARTGDNPASWEILSHKYSITHKTRHFDRIEPDDAPAFMARLRAVEGVAARALSFCIHTALRSRAVRSIQWSEVNLGKRILTVPKERLMKWKGRDRDFLVPLTDSTVSILEQQAAIKRTEFVFQSHWDTPGAISATEMLRIIREVLGEPHATVHGFRSTFRDWGEDQRKHDDDETGLFEWALLETALVHSVGTAVTPAYRRDDAFKKRVPLMARWSTYLDGAL